MIRSLLTAAAAIALSATASAQTFSDAYMRNFNATDNSLDRVASADKYVPTETVTGAPGAPLPVAPGSPAIAPDALERARAQADASHTMALLIYAKGRVQWESYAPGFSASSYFDSYSMHKGLLAVAVLLAVDHGFLRLDDPASRYIPAFAADARRSIKVRDLLSMQSGLAIPKFEVTPGNPVLEMFIGTDLKAALAASAAAGPPGVRFEFNHLNSQALLEVIEAASRMRYAAFLSRYLWRPLGAADARVALDHPGGEARGVCCFVNTAPNWLRLGVMLAGKGRFAGRRVLSARSVRLLSAASPLNPGYAMNMVRAQSFAGKGPDGKGIRASDLYYFEGHGGQRLYVVPSRGLAVFRTGRVDYDWDDVRFANTILGGLRD